MRLQLNLLNAAIPARTQCPLMLGCKKKNISLAERGKERGCISGAGEGPASSYLVIGLVVLFDNLLQEMEELLVEIFK